MVCLDFSVDALKLFELGEIRSTIVLLLFLALYPKAQSTFGVSSLFEPGRFGLLQFKLSLINSSNQNNSYP